MRIAVVTPEPKNGEKGGAENLYDSLVKSLCAAGHEATQVKILMDESSFESILEAYCTCFYLDLGDYDLVISTKSPTYMVKHRNHISYLLHTIRVFYDMFDKEPGPRDIERQKQKKLIHKLDQYGLSPERIRKHCVIGETVVQRLKDSDPFWNQVNFDVIYPGVAYPKFNDPKKGEFVFLPGRLHRWKRVDLVIKAMKYVENDVKLVIAGRGEDDAKLAKLVTELGLDERIRFVGAISTEDLLDFYSRSIVVPFVPIKEDYGYVTIEAFASKKPVITCSDSGEPSCIVKDGISGFVVDPDPKKIAEKISYLVENPLESERMGNNGYLSVQDITWENVIKRLLGNHPISPSNGLKYSNKCEILVTDNQIIDPPIGGGRVRLYDLYRNFNPAKFDINYLGTFDWLGPGEREQKLSEHFSEILVPLTVPHIWADRLCSKLCNSLTTLDVTIPFLMRFTPKYQRRLSRLAKDTDIIVVSHPWVYPYAKNVLSKNGKRPILIYDAHNCEYNIKKMLLSSTILGKLLVKATKNLEGSLAKDSDIIFACSEGDAKEISALYGVDQAKILVIPNGASCHDIPYPSDEEKQNARSQFGLEIAPNIIFLASGGYKPNDDAAEYICAKLAPYLVNINFIIVGSVCDTIRNRHKNDLKENIKLMGVVSFEDKKRLLYAADLALNPVVQGSGTNVKIFDYLSAGLPLITTDIGARGISFINYENAIIASLDKFPLEISNLLNDKALRDKLSKGSRITAENYDWKKIAANAEVGIANFKGYQR